MHEEWLEYSIERNAVSVFHAVCFARIIHNLHSLVMDFHHGIKLLRDLGTHKFILSVYQQLGKSHRSMGTENRKYLKVLQSCT